MSDRTWQLSEISCIVDKNHSKPHVKRDMSTVLLNLVIICIVFCLFVLSNVLNVNFLSSKICVLIVFILLLIELVHMHKEHLRNKSFISFLKVHF